MKVTITGRGVIPYVRAVAPVSGIEVDIKTIRALLNVPKFSVYDYATGIFINNANIDSFENPVVEEAPVVEAKPVAKPKKKKEEPQVEPVVEEAPVVEETPVVEEAKEEYVEPAVEVVPEEVPVEEPVAEEVPVEESVEEAAPAEETKPAYNGYNGKKKKHH